VILRQGRFEGTHLLCIDRGEKESAVGHEAFEEVGAQPIVGRIGPLDIRTAESPLHPVTDLSKERFILREGLVPMSVEQGGEALRHVMALITIEVEVMVELPENDSVGVTIGRGQ
jgi:hypothetical protein